MVRPRISMIEQKLQSPCSRATSDDVDLAAEQVPGQDAGGTIRQPQRIRREPRHGPACVERESSSVF
jgi:hypothetical protein